MSFLHYRERCDGEREFGERILSRRVVFHRPDADERSSADPKAAVCVWERAGWDGAQQVSDSIIEHKVDYRAVPFGLHFAFQQEWREMSGCDWIELSGWARAHYLSVEGKHPYDPPGCS
jgi:hypothetical protein